MGGGGVMWGNELLGGGLVSSFTSYAANAGLHHQRLIMSHPGEGNGEELGPKQQTQTVLGMQ